MKLLILGITGLLGAGLTSSHAGVHFQSGPRQTALLELYTSEGCSSCPPAEALFSRLKNDPGLWHQFVPVAFHVDYWDRLGWRDRFSSPSYTARQNRYAVLWRSDSVYTPAFVLNGKELPGWSGKLPVPNENSGLLNASSEDGRTWKITFEPAKGVAGTWQAHLALVGADISSQIGAGENSGRRLQHDFVVLAEEDAAMKTDSNRAIASLTIKGPGEPPPRQAVAVWVTHGDELPAVQATGGWLALR